MKMNRQSKVMLGLFLILSLTALSLLAACSTSSSSPAQPAPTSAAPAPPPQTSAAPAPSASGLTPKKGGILKIGGVSSQTLSLGYPPSMAGAIDGYASEPCLDTLFTYDKNLNIIPRLALDYKVSDDAKSITINLRKGVKFHDGSDFNAEVVKWNMDSFRATPKPDLKAVTSIDAVDDYTVRLNLSSFSSILVSSLCGDPGRMISEKAFDANGKAWCEKHPVGTGPFKFVSWDPDVSFKYERWDGYWGGPVYLDGYWRLIYADATSAEMAFRNGDFDIFLTSGQTARDLEKTGKYNFSISKYGKTPFLAGDSNNSDSPFKNIKVRQAMSYAIDVKTMCDSLSYGYGIVTNQWSLPGTPGYNPDVVGYPYNPDKAKQLLAEAGYANGFDTTISYFVSDWTTNRSTAVADYLSKVGIRATLVPQQLAQWDLTATKGGWKGIADVLTYTWPDVMTSMRDTMLNFRYISLARPPGLQDLYNQALLTPDQKAKWDIIKKIQKLMVDDFCMATWLDVEGDIACKNKYVHDDMWFDAAYGYLSGGAWMDK
jgi:peptide/nickel transport system substrate-binding protein